MQLPAVKQDPRTGAVALKLPAGSSLGDWGVMTQDRGGDFRSDREVADWIDLINPGAAIEAGQ